MERIIKYLEPIERAGIVLHKKVRKAGVNSSTWRKWDKVELAFRKLYQLKAFKELILKSEPNEEDRYLIFSPTSKPEHSLCWVVQDGSGRAAKERFNSGWEKDLYDSGSYYVIVANKQVAMCFDEHGEMYLKTHDGHNTKPHI